MNQHNSSGKDPYFSVIVPVYGVEAYLEQCIESILHQDFSDYELILVDDGSPDQCPEICDDYSRAYEHIHVVHKPNGGLSSARNAGLGAAKGTYIWWVDADDWIEEGSLLALYNASMEDDPDIVKYNHFRVRLASDAMCTNAQIGFYSGMEQTQKLLNQAFFAPGKFCLSAWSHIYKRVFLREHQLCFVSEREVGSEDYLFNLQALACARRVRVIDKPLYFYRLRAGSLTQRYRAKLIEQYTMLYRQLHEYYKRKQFYGFEGRICRFYVWHLIHGTCVGNEYRVTQEHSLEAGRRRLAAFLRSADFRYAARHCDCSGLSFAQRIQVYSMAMGAEPLLYWLYEVKPKRREGKRHEG